MYRLLPPRFIVALTVVALADIYLTGFIFHRLARLDLWVIFMVYYYFFYEREQSLTFAFVLGLIRDVLGQGAFGAMAISFPIASILLIRLGGTLNREKFYVQALALFGVTFLMLSCDLVVESAFYGQWMWLNRFSSRILYTSITTALGGPLVLSVMQKFLGSNPRQYELFA